MSRSSLLVVWGITTCLTVGCGDNDSEVDELAYIVNAESHTVSVVDTARAVVVATITVGHHPLAAAAQRDGRRVYVSNFDDQSVSIIDTETQRVVTSIALSGRPYPIVALPSGDRVYVAHGIDTVRGVSMKVRQVPREFSVPHR